MDYISLGLTIAFAVFLGLGFLLGFKRGLKRTVVRSVWILTIIIVLIFLSSVFTRMLFDINFNMNIDGKVFITLRDYITYLFEIGLPMQGADYTALVNLVIALVSMMLNIVVFLVGYWVLKLVTLILYWFSNIFIFAGERRRKRKARRAKQKYRIKKHRLLGALVGCVLGFISFCITLTPISGYISIAKDIEQHTANEQGSGVITDIAGDNYHKIMSVYDNSFPIKLIDSIGVDSLMGFMFDGMTSATFNEEKIVLSEEIKELADVYAITSKMSVPNFNVATQKEVKDFLDGTDMTIDAVFESKLVNASADTIIPFAAKYAKQSIDTTTYKPHELEFFNAFFDQFEGYNALTTKQEVKGAINVIRVLNERNLLLPILQDTTGDIVEFLKLNLTKPAVDEIMESVFSLKTVDKLAPAMVNFILAEGAERYDYEYSTENEVLSSTLKTGATIILYSTIDILNLYDPNNSTKVEINKTTVGALGSILDQIKQIVSQENFESIIEKFEPKLEETALNAIGSDAPQFLRDFISRIVGNISNISGFESSFTSLYEAYETAKEEYDNAYVESEGKYDVELMDFEKIGKSLNTFQNSDLVGRVLFLDTMKEAVVYGIDKAEAKITNDASFEFSFDDIVINNLEILKGTGLDWSQELPVYKTTTGIVANLLQDEGDILERLKSESDTTLERIGYELEHNLKTSNLFRGSDRSLVADLLDIADMKINTSEDEDLNNNLSTLLMDAKENVLNEPDLNWETEFKHIKTIIQVEFDDTSDENIIELAGTIDSIVFDTLDDDKNVVLEASVIFKQDMLNNFIVDYIDTVFGDVEEGDDLYSTIQQMKASFKNDTIKSYTHEFDAMLKLKSIEEVISAEDFDIKTDGGEIGAKIDTALAVGVEDGVDPKVVVTRTLVDTFIVDYLDAFTGEVAEGDSLYSTVQQIKTSFETETVECYEYEFEALSKLMEMEDVISDNSFDFKTDGAEIGVKIDNALAVGVEDGADPKVVVTKTLVNNFIVDHIDTMFEDVDEGDSFYTTIQEIKTSFNTKTISSYTHEFDAMSKLTNIENLISDANFELKTDGAEVGAKIDEALAVGVEDGVNPKVVVTKSLINNFIKGEIDGLMSDYTDLEKEIETIKNGFNDDIELYEVEMTAISRLMSVADTAADAGFDFGVKSDAQSLGADIDNALTKVTVGTEDYQSKIVDRALINGYLKRVITDEVSLAGSEFEEVLTTITGEKQQDDTYTQGRIDTFNSTYAKEFGYLSQLIAVSNNFTDITIDTINVKNVSTNTTVAEEFDGSSVVTDPLKNSYLVGDSLLLAIDSALDTFTTDPDNTDYSAILDEVNSNYASTKTQVNWISNSAGTTTYTEVVNALVEIENAINGDLTQDITNIEQVSSIANNYDTTLATLQENILLSINGTNELAQFAMTKVLDKLNEEKGKLAEAVKTKFDNCIAYADNYIKFLQHAKENMPEQKQPYVYASIVNVYKTGSGYTMTQPAGTYTTIQINNPFAKVGELIDSALGI